MKRGSLWAAILVVCCGAAAALNGGPWAGPIKDLPESADYPPETQSVTANQVPEVATWAAREWQEAAPIFTDEEKHRLLDGTNGGDNLCMYGKLVPELLVIGSMKAATTSLSQWLRLSPSMIFPPAEQNQSEELYPPRWKEGHYFDNYRRLGVNYLLLHSPVCDRRVRQVHVDASARYGLAAHVPGTIKLWYGSLAPRVKFVLTMRDPLVRMHSHYYHAVHMMFCSDFIHMSFNDVLGRIKTSEMYRRRWMGGRLTIHDRCGDFIEASLYTNHIRRYFEHFEPSQFTFIPFLFLAAPGKGGRPQAPASDAIWEMLGVRGREPPLLVHSNSRKHADLADDADPDRLSFVKAWLNSLTGPAAIAELLQGTDARLYGFKDNVRLLDWDRAAGFAATMDIADWIGDNW